MSSEMLCDNCSRELAILTAPLISGPRRVGSISLCGGCFKRTAMDGEGVAVEVPTITSHFWSKQARHAFRIYTCEREEATS